jgi:hypothetical protein
MSLKRCDEYRGMPDDDEQEIYTPTSGLATDSCLGRYRQQASLSSCMMVQALDKDADWCN